MTLRGRILVFGDHVDTDAIIPARYLNVSTPEELAEHCMEDWDASFVGQVQAGDVMAVAAGHCHRAARTLGGRRDAGNDAAQGPKLGR